MTSRRIPASRLSSRRRARRGVALLLTFVTVIIYLIISVHLSYVARYYVRSVNANKDQLYAEMTAKSGVVKAKAMLRLDDEAGYDSLNEKWANTQSISMQSGVDYPDNAGIEGVSSNTFDESGKFNLALLAWAIEQDDRELRDQIEESFERLIYIILRDDSRIEFDDDAPDYEGDTADVNPSSIVRGLQEYLTDEGGGDVGASASFNFDPKDRDKAVEKEGFWPAITIGELLLAENMTEAILYGPRYRAPQPDSDEQEEPTNYYADTRVDPSTGRELSDREAVENQSGEARVESAEARSTSTVPLALADFVTIWGDGKININTCDREVLLALSETMTWEMSTAILRARDAAYDRSARIEEDNVADEIDPNDPEAPDPNVEEEDNRSFRDGTGSAPATPAAGQPDGQPAAASTNDIGSAMAFYNRIAGALGDATEEFVEFDYEVVENAESVPEEWVTVFEELQPFLTVRSEYFRIVSKASAAEEENAPKQYCTVTAVYRRTVGQAPTAATTPDPNTGTNTPGGSADSRDITVPPEPSTELTLIFQDISFTAPRQKKN